MGTLHGIAKFLLMVPLLFFPAGSVFSQDILDYREITVGPEEVTVDNFHGVGVRAMGIGGAYVGVADDFSATYWNPAGLAQIREAWLYGALCHLSRRVNSTFFGESRPGEIGKSRLGSFGVVLPVPTYRGSLVFAIGYNRLKSFDAAHYMNGYNNDLEFQHDEEVTVEGQLGAWSIAGAVDVSPSVSIGGAINFWGGETDFSRELTLNDIRNVHPDIETLWGRFAYTDDYNGTNLKLAMMIRGMAGFRFGATVTSPVTFDVDKDWEDEYRTTTADSIFTWNLLGRQSSYKVRLPYSFGFGASWTHTKVMVAFGAHYTDWRQTEYDITPSEFVSNRDFKKKYKDAWRLYFGGEVLVPSTNIKLRAGYAWDPITYTGPRVIKYDPDRGLVYGSKIAVDDDRTWLTLGAGTLIDGVFSLDIAWVHGTWKQREGNLIQDHKADRIFLAGSYRF